MPPEVKWIGLTDEQVAEVLGQRDPAVDLAQKEKNKFENEVIDYMRSIYEFIESTAPPGTADEAFRVPQSASPRLIELSNAATSRKDKDE